MNPMYTKPCKYCRSQIDVKAKICPICGKKQKQHTLRIVLLSILGVFIVLGLLGAVLSSYAPSPNGGSSSQISNVTSDTNDISGTENNSKNVAESVNKIGDTITVDNWEIALNSVEIKDKIIKDEYDFGYYTYFSPEDGNKYLVANVTVKNTGKKSNTFMPSFNLGSNVGAKIIFQKTYTMKASDLLGLRDDLHDTNLNPLASKTGIIVFEVSDDVSNSLQDAKLVFYNNKYANDFTLG